MRGPSFIQTACARLVLACFVSLAFSPEHARAQGQAPAIPSAANPGSASDPNAPAIPSGKKDDTRLFDSASPYLDYGDFNMTEEENEDALYFQYGRFFGLSLGAGYEGATGNRGRLYEAALPRVDIRMQYWFNFNFAMDLGVWMANHQYSLGNVNTQVKLIGYGMHLKYYFDVKDASAALTFANPFIEFGAGAISKSEISSTSLAAGTNATFSADLGGGLEFPVVYKKTYFIVEALYHTQNFEDTLESNARVSDLTGGFLTVMGHFMFVW